MFLFTWLFDKLGYMPKIDMEVGKVNVTAQWPFPVEVEVKNLVEKPTPIKKRSVKNPVLKKATTRKTKVK